MYLYLYNREVGENLPFLPVVCIIPHKEPHHSSRIKNSIQQIYFWLKYIQFPKPLN